MSKNQSYIRNGVKGNHKAKINDTGTPIEVKTPWGVSVCQPDFYIVTNPSGDQFVMTPEDFKVQFKKVRVKK